MIFNIENIAHYLEDEQALKQANSEALEQFVQQYPYSGLLQLIYCKYLHLHNDIRLEEQLERCALVVSDRKRVYELLFQPALQAQIIEQEETFKPSPKEKTITDSTSSEETTVSTAISDPITEKEPTVIHNDSEEKEREKAKIIDELEKNILTEAVNASIQVDISEYEFEEPQPNALESATDPEEETERSFVSWFDKPTTPPPVQKTTGSIIDDFLNSGNKNDKTKKEVFSPANMAKMSLVANNQFVTETLATIYAKQGQIDKAIEIYQQLSLKNPEKKTFFASRIRFLKEKQQHNK